MKSGERNKKASLLIYKPTKQDEDVLSDLSQVNSICQPQCQFCYRVIFDVRD